MANVNDFFCLHDQPTSRPGSPLEQESNLSLQYEITVGSAHMVKVFFL
jgi:hypothetical protein